MGNSFRDVTKCRRWFYVRVSGGMSGQREFIGRQFSAISRQPFESTLRSQSGAEALANFLATAFSASTKSNSAKEAVSTRSHIHASIGATWNSEFITGQ
jgi:hypothetical protein